MAIKSLNHVGETSAFAVPSQPMGGPLPKVKKKKKNLLLKKILKI